MRQAGDALFHRQGQRGDAAPGAQGVPPGAAAVPAAARGHDLEIPRHVRVPRRHREAARDGAAGVHQPGGRARRGRPVHARLAGAHRRHEDPGAAPGARQVRLRRRLRRRAPRRGEEPRQGARVLVPLAQHRWDPKQQRPELWSLYNTRKHAGESLRVFPLSNWTELDVWQYIWLETGPDRAAVLRRGAPGGRARRDADHGRR